MVKLTREQLAAIHAAKRSEQLLVREMETGILSDVDKRSELRKELSLSLAKKLTWEQLAAIHAAKRSGLSKRDLFEFDVMLTAQERIRKQEKGILPFSPQGEAESDSLFFGKPEFKLNPRGTSFLFRGRNPVKITQIGKGTLTEYTNKFTKKENEKIDAMERLEETGTKEEFLKTNMLERGKLERFQ